MIRVLGILLVCFILVNLFLGLVNLVRDRSKKSRVVRNLTLRVVFSIALFIMVMVALFFERGTG